MVCFFLVAGITGIVLMAAFEFYGNNIQRGMIMNATGFIINWFAFYRERVLHVVKLRLMVLFGVVVVTFFVCPKKVTKEKARCRNCSACAALPTHNSQSLLVTSFITIKVFLFHCYFTISFVLLFL